MILDFATNLSKTEKAVEVFKGNYLAFKDKYQKVKFSYQSKLEEQDKRTARITELADTIETAKASLDVINQISEIYEEHSIRRKLEKVITSIIQVLFCQDNFEFVIFKKTIRNQQEVHLYKSEFRDGHRFLIPLDREPGGLCDIVDIVFRILILQQYPENQRLLILDEPIKNLSEELRPRFFEFFNKLCREFKIRYLVVTHENEYKEGIDKLYQFRHDGNKTVVEKVDNQ